MNSLTDADIKLIQMHDPVYGVGLLAPVLCAQYPFRDLTAGSMVGGLYSQLRRRHHLVALNGRAISGYIGWGMGTFETGRAWAWGEKSPKPGDIEAGECVLLLAVWAERPEVVRALIRQLRILHAGRTYFGLRMTPDGWERPIKAQLMPVADMSSRQTVKTRAPVWPTDVFEFC